MHSDSEKNSRDLFLPALILFLVGVHSILLGLTVYFFTDFFYKVFFNTSVENIFFVRQSGTFLFLAGLFYLYPLINLRKFYNLILLVIFSKAVAVFFLISNAAFTTAPVMIYLAAFFDGLMAVALVGVYFRIKTNKALSKKSTTLEHGSSVKETA